MRVPQVEREALLVQDDTARVLLAEREPRFAPFLPFTPHHLAKLLFPPASPLNPPSQRSLWLQSVAGWGGGRREKESEREREIDRKSVV